jgi:cell filamentation protein
MNKQNRYDTSDLIENQYEPGSRGKVLKNLLGIKSTQRMDRVETREFLRASEQLMVTFDQKHRFTATDIIDMHKVWLRNIYAWAGRYRLVTLSKAGFPFAAPAFIPRLMEEFEKTILHENTPCIFETQEKIVESLSIVHVELLLIHPFREGNGRVARLLAALMALQAGLPFLDFSDIYGKRKEKYLAAVRAGLNHDYEPMQMIFRDVIFSSLASAKGRT